jgi:transcriptional regulator with XRE-family HTH domain
VEQEIGLLIRDLRQKHKHTLKDLATKINFDYSNLSKIERGGRKPTFELLESVSQLYDVPMSYFFRERDTPKELNAKWFTVIKESEDKGYSPEEIQDIIQFVEELKNKGK